MGAPMTAPMTYAAPPSPRMPQQQLAIVEQPMNYGAMTQMTYAAPPSVPQQQMVYAAPPGVPQQQMVYAAAPQQQMVYASAPQQQLAVRTNPNNLFQGGNIVSEGPVPRQQLIQEGRLFEGEPEKAPVVIRGQMYDVQALMLQLSQQVPQQQMVQEVFVEPQGVMAAPPMTYAQVPAVQVFEDQVQYAAPPQIVIQEPLANGFGQPQVQYAALPAGSVMVEEVLTAQPVQEQGVAYGQPEVYAQPMMQQPLVEYGQPVQQGAVLSGRKGTITNALFDLLDVNADGKISKSEFRRGLKGELIQVGQVANLPVAR